MPRHEATEWIDENWETLRNFNRQWIAATSEGVLEHGEDAEAVIARIDERRVDRRTVVFSFVCFDTIA